MVKPSQPAQQTVKIRVQSFPTPLPLSNGVMNGTFSYVKADITQPNSAHYFLTPFGKTINELDQQLSIPNDPSIDINAILTDKQRLDLMSNSDAYEQYVLIRLPVELGGNATDVSAFRAYSALDPESHCILHYYMPRENPDLNQSSYLLEDPCHNDIIRVSDGYSCFGHIAVGPNIVVSGYNALPRMKLLIDSQGYIVASKPDGQPTGDGTVGEGRIITVAEIQGNKDVSCGRIRGKG